MTRFFEDIRVGEQIDLGSHTFTPQEIVSFAQRYDPQPFHTDEKLAAESHFGGLIASGWHTAAVWMGLMAAYQSRRAEQLALAHAPIARLGPSPGFRELKWLRPVRAGDTVSYRSRAMDKIELRSKPAWGLLVSRNEGCNQAGELVFSFIGQVFVGRRAPPG